MTVDRPDLGAIRKRLKRVDPIQPRKDALALLVELDRLDRMLTRCMEAHDRVCAERDLYRDGIRQHRDDWSKEGRPKCQCPPSDPEKPWLVETVPECPWHGDDEYRVQVPGPRESNRRLWALLDSGGDA